MVVTVVTQTQPNDWVLLSYRIPREPSTPRIAVWRKLKTIGVVQMGDGLVALPHAARTQESLEWVSAQIHEAGGQASVWVASPTRRIDGAELAETQRAARTAEYAVLRAEVEEELERAATLEQVISPRTIAKWRRQWRNIDRRDYLGAAGKDQAKQAIANASPTTPRATHPQKAVNT